MIRKKMPTRKSIIKKLDELEAKQFFRDEPFITFIGKLPDGRYEVVEHYDGNRGVKRETKIINTKEEYLAKTRSGVIIHGEEDLTDVLKDVINDDYSKIKIESKDDEE
jgi:hypothetical protein